MGGTSWPVGLEKPGPRKAPGAGDVWGADSVTRSGNEEGTGSGGGRGGKELGSLECQAEGAGLYLLALLLTSFIMDSKASLVPSVRTQRRKLRLDGRGAGSLGLRTVLSGVVNTAYPR